MENGELHKNDFILLAGAGASCGIGYPTLNGVLKQAVLENDDIADLIRKIHNSIEIGNINTAVFEEIISKIKECINIVHLLRTYPVLRDEIRQIPQDITNGNLETKFRKALIRCYKILVKSYGPDIIKTDSNDFNFLAQLYEVLSRKNSRLDIYTTNYDCSYQVFASNCNNVSFYSHIHNEKGSFGESWYNSRKDLEQSNLPEIYVHRLHGCVTWFNDKDKEGGSGDTLEKYGSGGGDKEIQISDEELHSMCIKLVASQLTGTNRVFASAFEEFNKHLKDIKILLVWGYSFQDLEVTRLINDALSSRPDNPFKIFYIDPYLTEFGVKENIRKTLRNAPVQESKHFTPIQIDWTPNDGREELIKNIIKIIGG